MKRELIGVMELESGIGDFAKVSRRGLTVLCQNFGGRVEGMRDFWYY
jgi:hypothetical protein